MGGVEEAKNLSLKDIPSMAKDGDRLTSEALAVEALVVEAFERRFPLQPMQLQSPFWPWISHKACGANSLGDRKI